LKAILHRQNPGRKHQIRVHLASLGYRVIGDRRYGNKSDPCRRLALHAGGLLLAHPLTGERLNLISRLPNGLHKLLS
jgi:23S rRNA pseudouridine1911/1915/1917 synthase